MERARAILATEMRGSVGQFDAVPERIESELLMVDAMAFYFDLRGADNDREKIAKRIVGLLR